MNNIGKEVIKKLEAENERLQADKTAISQTASDYLHEIEQLRAALREISELGPEGEEIPCGNKSDLFEQYDDGFCEAWRRAGVIARRALDGEKDE